MTTDQGFPGAYRVLARSLLQRAHGFDQCPAALLDDLLADAQVARVAANQSLIARGERVEHLVLVVEGVLGARVTLSSGRRHLLAFMLPGMTVGFVSLVDEGPLQHDLIAQAPSVVMQMPMASVRLLCRQRRELLLALQMQLAERLRRTFDAVVYSKTVSLRDRVIMQLAGLADWVGLRRGERLAIELPMSQSDLADLVGAGRQSVNAELQRLQALGLMRVLRSRLDVLDPEGLRRQLPIDMPPLQLRLP